MTKVISYLFLAILLLPAITLRGQGQSLPVGSHPPALPVEHFPNRMYAFVWRNWNLVNPAVMGKTIGCNAVEIRDIAASMGLPPYQMKHAAFAKRIYITVIRRNWHLLPYEQLLTLLDMRSDELALALKEDDFLFVKLGNLKPAVERLDYSRPDSQTHAQAAAIKKLAEKYFQPGADADAVPLFSFIGDLEKKDASAMPNTSPGKEVEQLRYIYSYFGIFGDPLIDTIQNPYPDGLLQKLSAKGVNGIWMHVVLNQLAPGGPDFPEFGADHTTRIANLKRIVDRAKKYGISVYLYMNEPRAMPASFFTNRDEMRGTGEGAFNAMCTSNEKVLNWVKNSLTYVFKSVPQLGGVFTITASENFTNCASHGNQQACPRCSLRNYADVIAGINSAIEEGVHRGSANARVIVWDWGWHNHGLAPDVIAALPKSVWLMSVSEWAKPINRGGIASSVGEYSISAVGPGPRAKQHWGWAKQAGLKTVAKVQFNNSWELSAVPWLPVFDLVAQHAAYLADANTDGLMLSWSLGGYPSPNLEIANSYAMHPGINKDDVLNELAQKRYGAAAIGPARKAWTAFSQAFEEFPYSGSTLYNAPQQYGPSNLLYEKPTGYTATMVGLPYDDLKSWRGIYPQGIFSDQFNKVAEGWQHGLQYFKQVVYAADREKRLMAVADEGIAKATYLHFASVANQVRFVMCRDSLLSPALSNDTRTQLSEEIRAVLNDEISLASQLFDICRRDSRIGYEASNQYYYVPQDLIEKIINCDYLLKRFRSNRRSGSGTAGNKQRLSNIVYLPK